MCNPLKSRSNSLGGVLAHYAIGADVVVRVTGGEFELEASSEQDAIVFEQKARELDGDLEIVEVVAVRFLVSIGGGLGKIEPEAQLASESVFAFGLNTMNERIFLRGLLRERIFDANLRIG